MTKFSTRRPAWAAATIVAGLLSSVAVAQAGGFAIREQSTQFLGTAFAGDAAGGGLSSMFWNPAALGQARGIQSESNLTGILPYSTITALPGSTLLALGADSGNIGLPAAIASSYYAYEFSDRLVAGVSINSPFGMATRSNNDMWAGRTHASTSDIRTYNFTPTISYRLTPQIMIGLGIQIEHIWGNLQQKAGVVPTSGTIGIDGTDTSAGYTLGLLWTPTEATSLGLGYRSGIKHNLVGTLTLNSLNLGDAGVTAALTTPDTVTASFRHRFTPQFTVLGSVEWARWSVLDKLDIVCQGNARAVNILGCPAANGAGTIASTLPLNWHDGWMFALGGEYMLNKQITLRAGGAYEISPVQNPSERTPRVPDSDRIWASVGASYNWNDKLTIDVAYSHVFFAGGQIDRTASGIRLLADVQTQLDILSIGMKYKWYTPPKAVMTKG